MHRRLSKQRVSPAGHAQAPATQVSRESHRTPQRPQFNGSVCRSTHEAPHTERPASQRHMPSRQNCGGRHTTSPLSQLGAASHTPSTHARQARHRRPQAPQLAVSVRASTQRAPHAIRPVGHTHVPASQTPPCWQRRPQPPQCVGSDRVSTHAPGHGVSPGAHASQAPCAQISRSAQARAQAPQLRASD